MAGVADEVVDLMFSIDCPLLDYFKSWMKTMAESKLINKMVNNLVKNLIKSMTVKNHRHISTARTRITYFH